MHRTGRLAPHEDTIRITAARRGHTDQVGGRQRRYLYSMGLRTLCFVLAVVTDGTLRWIFIAGAVILPYIAVVVANASHEVDDDAPQPFYDDTRLMLEPGPAGHPDDPQDESQESDRKPPGQ